ncbi:cell division protein FtsQ/DivIB [Paracoccus sp. p4-l81]|uniref:cell division protein FtsQ/DivIB n=1 Tax=unclassified Paracoccus (in: a-proteobacteria) TaxID=2688777 RepID=UPI0035B89F05
MHALTPPGGPQGPGHRLSPRPVRGTAYGPVAGARPPRRDPAPSRLAYRLNRLWLKPMIRRLVRVGAPALLIALTAGIILSNADRRDAMSAGLNSMVRSVQERPEFQVDLLKIDGASPIVAEGIRDMLPVALPASSFDLDLTRLRDDVAALDAVAAVDMRIRGGVLEVAITERQPALLWRHATGIEIIDATGHRVATVTGRDVRADLPLVAGEGAERAAPEAIALMDAAGPILPRVRGLERMGDRRWDLVLDRGQRILLPAEGARIALERALAMDKAQDILSRDVTAIDMREDGRVILRVGPDAMRDLLRQRGVVVEEPATAGAAPAKPKRRG